MRKVLPILIAAGVCGAAMAEKTLKDAVRVSAPKFVDVTGFGGAAADTVFYDNAIAPYGYIWYLLDEPPTILDDCSLTPGPFAGGPAHINVSIQGWIELSTHSFDMYTQYWDNVDLTNSNTPINDTFLGGYFIQVRNQGAGAWYTILDLTGIGGIDLPDDNFGVEHIWMEPGSTTTLSDQGSAIYSYRGATQQTIGFTDDIGWFDGAFGTPDGVYDPTDGFFAGGAPFYTGIYYQASGTAGGSCCPSDTNCDGSVNGFDIQGFVAVLNGGAGCSPCTGDTNADGSVNGFDISGFVDDLNGDPCP